MSDQYERLSARFPAEVHKRVNKGGGDQTYVPAVDIFDRVDEVLGVTGWQARVIREGMTATEAWVLAEVAAHIDGEVCVRQQYGCEAITVGRDAKPVGDLFKKAATDAYKKCLTLLGVARYLYDADERREVEAEMREANRPKPANATKPTPISAARRALETAYADGLKYAKTIGMKPESLDISTLSDDDLSEVVEGLRTQCRHVLEARKTEAAKQAEAS